MKTFKLHEVYLDLNTNNCYYFEKATKNGLQFCDMYGYDITFSFKYADKYLTSYF